MRIIAPPLIPHANRSTLMFICNDKKPINIRAYKMRTNGLCSIEVGMINYNVMYSPRGIINLAHSDAQLNTYYRRGNSMRLNGIDAVMLGREELKKMIPFADFSSSARFPIFGGLMRSEERRVGKECRSRWWPEH